MNGQPDGLSELFRRYRLACPDPEPSPNFTPGLWRKIEARRNFASRLAFWARGLASLTAAACLAVVIFQLSPLGLFTPVTLTYVEILNDDDGPERLAYADVVPDQRVVFTEAGESR